MESPLRGRHAIAKDPAFRLIETLGWHPGEGFRHLSTHVARLARSAAAFDIPFSSAAIDALLADVSDVVPLRCRLTLDAAGNGALNTAPLGDTAALWRLGINETQLDPDDIWLQHKTTRRHVYDHARATLPPDVDEQLFLNTRGEICEGTITNIFVTTTDGDVLTPPLTSGLLPGVLRHRLIAAGQAREAVLRLADLEAAAKIEMGNSLRGLILAHLV
ncbi:aminotransferase class IV family protein [Phaeobacter sp.]|uniref:aminotransferase class IV family protein n=1 Tax=Phaeobacter sp. TaxID=1902409 RepID=UPI0025FCE031|nr:aminotransferase class IV family protein [Phaeobacter sp.]